MPTTTETDALRDYLTKLANGYVRIEELAEVRRLATADLQAQRDEAAALLRDVVDGEEGDYPIQKIRAFLTRSDR